MAEHPAHTMPTGGFLAGLIVKPLRETWLSFPQQSYGESIPWCHCDSRWVLKPIMIIHQGNSHHKCSNIILDRWLQKKCVKPLLLKSISFSCAETGNITAITSHTVNCCNLRSRFPLRWHKCCFDNHLLSLGITALFYQLISPLKHISSDYPELNAFTSGN